MISNKKLKLIRINIFIQTCLLISTNKLTYSKETAAVKEKVKVFICYPGEKSSGTHEHYKHAQGIYQHLQNTNYTTAFLDKPDMKGGVEWEVDIKKRIEEANIFLCIVTPNILSHEYCYEEINLAEQKRKNNPNFLIIPTPSTPTTLKNINSLGKYQSLLNDDEKSIKLMLKNQDESIVYQRIGDKVIDIAEKLIKGLYNTLPSNIKLKKERFYLGIDLGTTKIAAGIIKFNSDNTPEYDEKTFVKRVFDDEYKKKTTQENKESYIKELLSGIIHLAISENPNLHSISDIDAFGVGLPGQVNVEEKKLYLAPGLNLKNMNFEKILSVHGRPVYIDNDVNCATLAEMIQNKELKGKNFVCIYYGTGVGAGIVINGNLIRGNTYSAGEIGHTKIDSSKQARECNCGKLGCYEEYSSTRAVEREVKKVFLNKMYDAKLEAKQKAVIQSNIDHNIISIKTENVAEYLQNEKNIMYDICERVIIQVAEDVAIGLANVTTFLDPYKIIIGGGLIEGFYENTSFRKKLEESFNNFVFDHRENKEDKTFRDLVIKTKLTQSKKDNINIGPILGAAYLPIDLEGYSN